MWELARRNLFRERTRLAISVLGVAFAVVLMLVLSGLYTSYVNRIGNYYQQTAADLWVVQSGTANFYHSSSVLPAQAGSQIQGVQGVASVSPYLGRQVAFQRGGKDFITYAVAVPEGETVQGPVNVEEGSADPGSGEIVIDRVLARQANLGLGDTIDLRGTSFEIVGITSGGDMIMYQYSWITFADALELQGNSEIVNFFRVQLLDVADVASVQRGIEGAVPGAEAWTVPYVIDQNQGLIRETFLPVVSVLLFIGFAVGTAVIGLTTYSTILEKRREYGILKAIGARSGALFRTLLGQSGTSGLIGYLVGTVISFVLAVWVPKKVPQFSIDIGLGAVLWVLAAAAGMVVVSVGLPLLRLRRIDPAEVFKA